MTDDLEQSPDAPECSEHVARVLGFHPLTGEPDDRGIQKICDWAVRPEDITAIPIVVTVKPSDGEKLDPVKGIELRISTLDEEDSEFFLPHAAALALVAMVATMLGLTDRIDVSVVDDEPAYSTSARGPYL